MKKSLIKNAKLVLITLCVLEVNGADKKREDFQSLFLTVQHERFFRAVRPWEDDWIVKAKPLSSAEREKFLEGIAKNGSLDAENYFAEFRSDSGTGLFVRTFAVFFSAEEYPIMAVSERSGSSHNSITDFFLLCRPKVEWIDCTNSIFPSIDKREYLKPGEGLGENSFVYSYVKLPRKGTTVELTFILDEYMAGQSSYPNAPTAAEADLKKFRAPVFRFVWAKKQSKFVLKP